MMLARSGGVCEMRLAVRALALIVVVVSWLAPSPAQETRAYDLVASTYFECAEPESLGCIASTEDRGREICPDCIGWVERPYFENSSLGFDPLAYSYETGPPRANVFANDAVEQLYPGEFPRGPAGIPVVSAELFERTEELGWTEVSNGRTGTLAVTRSWVGVVVSDAQGDIRVLYPSHALNGQLTVGDIENIIGDQDVKFILPGDFQALQN